MVGWFAPSYRIISEAYNEMANALADVKTGSSKTEGVIRTLNNGRADFWSLENPRAGRSRKYHLVIIDEAAFAKDDMMDIWEKSIEPTLLDFKDKPYGGRCLVTSNTNGESDTNFFYLICTQKKYQFAEYHAPTRTNPYMPSAEIEVLKRRLHPLIFQQEYLAEFVDFSGEAFFSLDKMLIEGKPIPFPEHCETVVGIMDTAVKEGKEHDGTGVSYYAVMPDWFTDYRMVVLDWDIVQMEGSMLEEWAPSVYKRLEDLAAQCKAMFGSIGLYIEDAQSGSILLQQLQRRGLDAEPLPEILKNKGKDTRALNISGAHWRGDIKISTYAYEKVSTYKDITRNHFLTQVTGFRVGDKDAAKRADDLFDTYCYAVAITLGNSDGIA